MESGTNTLPRIKKFLIIKYYEIEEQCVLKNIKDTKMHFFINFIHKNKDLVKIRTSSKIISSKNNLQIDLIFFNNSMTDCYIVPFEEYRIIEIKTKTNDIGKFPLKDELFQQLLNDKVDVNTFKMHLENEYKVSRKVVLVAHPNDAIVLGVLN